MLLLFVRALILYSLILLGTRLMGKRQIGQLQPFEFSITLLIAEVAAIPLTDTSIPLLKGAITIGTLIFAQLFISYIALKSDKAREFISGRPVILVSNGKIIEEELRKERYNINDLIEQLRVSGYDNLFDVAFAILENNGQVSVIPKANKRPVTPEDLNIKVDNSTLTYDVIIDGRLMSQNLKELNVEKKWLMGELKKNNINSISEVFYASLDINKNLFFQKKENI